MKRRFALKAACAALAVSGLVSLPALAADTIKVGILHSLSGTMAISETVLKDVALMTIDEINAKGGVLGKKLEPVVVDPASNWPLFAEKAKQLIAQDKVAVVFGCWTSVSRKSVLPVFEESQRPALLSGAVRGRRALEERLLHRRGAEPAGDSGGRVPDEQGRRLGQALRAARHRLRLSAHDQQDPALLPAQQGHQGRRHHGGVHAVRPLRLPDDHRQDQEVRCRRQEDGGGLDDQRRLERAVLQGARQPGPEGDGRSGRRLLGRRGRAARRRHQAAGRPPGGVELLRVDQEPDQHRLHQGVDASTRSRRTSPATRTSRSPTTRWRPPTSASTCGRRRSRRPSRPIPTR